MYRCENCNKCVKPKTPCKRVVTQKVKYHHPERARAKRMMMEQKNGKQKMVWIPDPGGVGYQIVKETRMCPSCAAKWEKLEKEATL